MPRFIRSSPEALGGFGFPVILIFMVFNDHLRHPLQNSFLALLWEASCVSIGIVLPLLLGVAFFLHNSSKPRSDVVLSKEKRGREERLKVGYLRVARDIFLLDLIGSASAMTMTLLWSSSKWHLTCGQFLIVALCISVIGTIIHILYLKFSDHLTSKLPRPTSSLTELTR